MFTMILNYIFDTDIATKYEVFNGLKSLRRYIFALHIIGDHNC